MSKRTQKKVIIIIWISLIVLLIASYFAQAEAYTDEEIVNAIYQAEGGEKAHFPYGIRSLRYENRSDRSLSRHEWARMICLNTVKNNRKRYKDYGYKQYDDFISFLGSRYCPTSGNLSAAERRLNGNWIKNVNYFLNKG